MYELIQHQEVGAGGASSITFSGIPQTYTDLYLVISARTDRAATDEIIYLSFNGETTGFSSRELDGNGSAAFSGTLARLAGAANGSTSTSNTFSNVSVYFPNYQSSNNKSYSADSVLENNATFGQQIIVAGLRADTDPIDNITLTPANGHDFVQYTTATLFGVGRKAGIGRQPLASGGYTSFVDGYWIHTFTANGSFKPFVDMDVEYLVVAGGGGGGGGDNGYPAGGGGAGGYRSSVAGELSGGGASAESALSLTASTIYTVTVGAGGAKGVGTSGGTSTNGTNGGNSTFSTVTAIGGGGGGAGDQSNSPLAGNSGGSGGGGGTGPTAGASGGAGTSSQGFVGGSAQVSGYDYGGGGGGASSAGINATGVIAGDGGSGLQSSITGSIVARAGGGGAGTFNEAIATGGAGGGGVGATVVPGTDATAGAVSTGGGGGGGGDAPGTGRDSAAGGSGIVIVRYRA